MVAIVATSTQNSEPSFAIGAPALPGSEKFDCDPAVQVQARIAPTMREELRTSENPELASIPLTPIPTHEEIQASENAEVAQPISIPLAPAPIQEDVQASENDEIAEIAEIAEQLPTNDNSTQEAAVPLPTRKPVAKSFLGSIDTKDGARSVQRRLRDLGYLADHADGSWGPRSRLALKQFQLRARISPANGWNRQTERVLFSRNAPRALSSVPSPFVQATL